MNLNRFDSTSITMSKWFQLGSIILVITLEMVVGIGSPKIIQMFLGEPTLLLLGLGGVAVFVFLLRHISVLIFLVVLYTPVELLVLKWLPGVIGTASRYISESFLLFAFLALFFDRLLLHKPWKRTPLDLPLLIFVSIGVLSAIVNKVPPKVAILGLRILLRYVLLFYLVVQIGFTREVTRRLVTAILGMAVVVVGIGLSQAVVGPPLTEILRVSETRIGEMTLRKISNVSTTRGHYIFSTLGRYDMLGMYTVVILLLMLALYIHYPRYHKLLRWLIISTGICLVLTMSRQSWLAIYISLWSWALLSKKKWIMGLMFVLSLVPVSLVSIAWIFPYTVQYFPSVEVGHATVLARMLEPFSPEYLWISGYSSGRLYVLRFVGQRILKLAPLLGFGPGHFGSLTATYFKFSTAELLGMNDSSVYLINDVNWITILGQYGLIGTLAFLMMFVVLLRYAGRIYKRSSDPLTRSIALSSVGGIIALLLLGFFGPNFEQRVISMYVWLMAGLTVSLGHVERHMIGIQNRLY